MDMTQSDCTTDEMPPLPELQQADLDQHQLGRYLAELSERADGLRIMAKNGPRDKFEPLSGVSELAIVVASRKVWGAQLRYRVDGKTWLDTLLVKPNAVRLVRMAEQPVALA